MRRLLLERLDRLRDRLAVPALRRVARQVVRRVGLTRVGAAALAGAVVPWVVARVVAGTALYLFAYGALLVVVLGYLVAPRRLRLEGIRTGLFPRAQEREHLEVRLTVTAGRRLTSFFVEERVPERLGATVRVPVPVARRGDTVEHTYGISCSRRGVYRVGPLVAVARDPFGLTRRETVLAEPFELLVHPRVEVVDDRPLTRLNEDPPIRPPVSRPWPSGMEFYGMREYQRGDDPRRIMWRATARTGRLMVWEAEQGITDRITLVLDTDRTHHSQDGEWSESFEAGVRAAASLGYRHLVEGYELRTEANRGPLVRALRGVDKTLPFLDALARVERDRTPLTEVLRRLVADARRDAHMVLITPCLTTDTTAQLKLLTDKGVSVLVVALLWNDEDTQTTARAAALGCSVVGIHPGDDLASRLRGSSGRSLVGSR